MNIDYDVVIIGAGPAGMSAAIYASRANLKTLLLDNGAPGGKLLKTNDIENFPGSMKVNGGDLSLKMFEHAQAFGAVYEYGNVVKIDSFDDHKEVMLDDQRVINTKTIIIATGTNDGLMNIKGETEYTGRGVSYCAVCDAAFFRNKIVCVIGGGNSALEEAMYLTAFASKVHLIVRRDEFRAEPIVQSRLKENEKIEVHFLKKPKEVIGDGNVVTGLLIMDSNDGTESLIECSGIFPFVGATPATAFAKDLGILNEKGYIIVNEKMETKVLGIYGAGDVNEKVLRQVVTAVNDGAIAGQQAYHYIKMHS